MSERHIHSDPPSPHELQALASDVHTVLQHGLPADQRASVAHAIAVAGTATSAAAIAQELDPYDSSRVHGYKLDLSTVELLLARLAHTLLQARHVGLERVYGRLGGLGLDVFATEPYPADGPLLNHPRIVATAHTASLTSDYFAAASRRLGDALAAYLDNQPPAGLLTTPSDRGSAVRPRDAGHGRVSDLLTPPGTAA